MVFLLGTFNLLNITVLEDIINISIQFCCTCKNAISIFLLGIFNLLNITILEDTINILTQFINIYLIYTTLIDTTNISIQLCCTCKNAISIFLTY